MKNIKYILLLLMLLIPVKHISGETADYVNNTTGYEIYIIDECDLLSAEEEKKLLNDMIPVSEYGNVAFVSVYSDESTPVYAKNKYEQLFDDDSGSMFVIDMENRNIWIHSNGRIYRTVTKAYANTITDNVYRYASDENYYECAANVFRQEYTLLEGGRIAQPMKYASNLIISFIVALLGNFIFLQMSTGKPKFTETETVDALKNESLVIVSAAKLISRKSHRRRQHSYYSSGSSYSSHSSSGGHSYSGHSSSGHSSSSHSSSSSSSGSRSSGGGGGHKF